MAGMTGTVPLPAAKKGMTWLTTAGIAAAGLAVCAIAISTQSYWIDEAGVAYKATIPKLPDFWRFLRAEVNADLQQPLHHFFAWGWEKLVGVNEFAMRAGNVPWFLLGLIAITRALGAAVQLRCGMILALLSSAFAWYYLDEARPYTMQIGASLMVFGSLYRLAQAPAQPGQELGWVLALCAGSFVLAASGMLAALWLGAYLGAALVCAPRERLLRLARDFWPWWGASMVLLLALGGFYLWTLHIGARATAIGTTDIRNFLFIPFELLGFSGLGPGRLSIRTGGVRAFLPWLPWLGIYGVALAIVLAKGWQELAQTTARRTRVFWALAFLLVAGFILGVGVAVHFRVLGRHCAPVFPLILFVLASGIAAFIRNGGRAGKLAVGAFVALSLASCLMMRFSARHAKDDYRGAAALGREALARGETVWWNAAEDGALIYHLPVARRPATPDTAVLVAYPKQGFDRGLPRPDLVFTSKPDVYDEVGAVNDYLAREGFRPTPSVAAFTLWRPPGK
jgi:hypothetical protein